MTPLRRRDERRKTVMRGIPFLLLGIVLPFVSGVLLVPLYLRYIPTHLYGAWLATGNVLAWLTIVDPGVAAILQQRVANAYGANEHMAISAWVGGGLAISGCVIIIIIALGFSVSEMLPALIHIPSSGETDVLVRAFQWSVVGSALTVFAFSLAAINQGLQSSFWIGVIYNGALIVRIATVILLLKCGLGLMALGIASVLMGSCFVLGQATYLVYRMKSEGFSFTVDPREIRNIGSLLSFTALSRVAGTLANNLDLFLVARSLGVTDVTILKFSKSLPEMSRLVIDRPYAAMQPALSHLLGSGNMARARELLLRLFILSTSLLVLIGGCFVAFNRDFVQLWVGAKFYAGNTINLLIVAWALGSVIISVTSAVCFAAGDIRKNSLASMAQAVAYLPLLWAGAHWFGILGVLLASLLSIGLTQGVYLPKAFVRIYEVSPKECKLLAKTATISGVAAILVILMFWDVRSTNWFGLCLRVTEFTGCYIAFVLLLSSEVRAEVVICKNWVRSNFLTPVHRKS